MEKVTYRHNVMDIGSLEAFFSIRGGCNNHIRDVYFIRALGECEDYTGRIEKIERRFRAEDSDGRLRYTRISGFAAPAGEQVQKISAVYDAWRESGRVGLDGLSSNENLKQTVSDALAKTLSVYREAGANRSASMMKNFAIKLLFWTEENIAPFFHAWDERACMKIVLENVAKEQEYLFGYFLTLLGCDVLLLENKCDVEIPDSLRQLSGVMMLGGFGSTRLTPYVQAAAAGESIAQVQDDPGRREAVRVVIPARVRKKPQQPRPSVQQAVHTRETTVHKASEAGAGRTTLREEKTFEELAQMASSIVMIADHDRSGEVVGTGSGIMIGQMGYILTNHHVIAAGQSYSVRIEDDDEIYYTDEIIKYHPVLDLAVIRIERRLRPLAIYGGKERLARGQKVVAIGSPLGLFNSVSDGIISGFRNINKTDMIQFTAPISPGSSGGAVLNMYGEVIGISTAGFDSGQNINLAVGYESIRMFARGFFDE